MQSAGAQVIVYFHLGIASKLERIGLKVAQPESLEHQGQAASHHIVEVHHIFLAVALGQAHKPSRHGNRQLKVGIPGLLPPLASCIIMELDAKVYAFVGLVVEHLDCSKPHRHYEPVKMVAIILIYKFQLFFGNFLVVHKVYPLLSQLLGDELHRMLILFAILRIELVYLLDYFHCALALGGSQLIAALGDAALRGNTHAEKFIKII